MLFDKFLSILCFFLVLADFHSLFSIAIDYRDHWTKDMTIKTKEKHKKYKEELSEILKGKKDFRKENKIPSDEKSDNEG